MHNYQPPSFIEVGKHSTIKFSYVNYSILFYIKQVNRLKRYNIVNMYAIVMNKDNFGLTGIVLHQL